MAFFFFFLVLLEAQDISWDPIKIHAKYLKKNNYEKNLPYEIEFRTSKSSFTT